MIGLLLLYWICCSCICAEDKVERSLRKEPLQYCPYFQNRGPARQDNLRNCSWYKDSACCYDEEIDFAFRQLTPLIGASQDCSQNLNYLYCYICAPNQNMFFQEFTLTVCEEFCDRVFSSCKGAQLKGRKIGNIYKNGTEFCKGRRFQTDKQANGKCFTFNSKQRKSSSQKVVVTSASLIPWLFIVLFLLSDWFRDRSRVAPVESNHSSYARMGICTFHAFSCNYYHQSTSFREIPSWSLGQTARLCQLRWLLDLSVF